MSAFDGFANVQPKDLFHPCHYRQVRQAREIAETLPGWCYTSQEFYERERDSIFFRQWTCIGHQGRVPHAGSYITLDFLGVPVLVVRDQNLQLHAYVNQCTHRGALLATGEGDCKQIKCPYHAWAFSLEGELLGTPLFEESAAFQKSDHGLRRIRLESWSGLMWINFDPGSPDLLSHLGDLPQRTAAWNLEKMVCVSRTGKLIKANAFAGLRAPDPNLVALYRAFGAGRRQLFFGVRLPSASTAIFSGLEISVVLALIGAVVAELLASRRGLGNVIASAGASFNVAMMFACVVVLAVIGMLFTQLVRWGRRRLIFWERVTTRTSTMI